MRKPANSFLSDSIHRKFFTLTFLNILSNITIPLTGIADTAVLGNAGQSIAIAGVSLGTVLFDYLYWGFGFLRMGTTGTTAIKTGQGDEEGAYLVLVRSLILGFGIGSVIFALSPWIGVVSFQLLSGTDELKEIGRTYFQSRVWDAPFTMMNLVIVGWFLGRSRSDLVLLLTLVGNLSNVALDILFVFGWGMGADGVGIASGIAQTLQFFLGMGILRSIGKSPGSGWADLRSKVFRKAEFMQLLSFNQDIFLRTVFLIVTFSMFRNFSASMGVEVLTVNAILLQFMLVFAFFVDGAAYATEAMAGDLYGRGKKSELDGILRLGFGFGLVVSLGFSLVLGIFPETVLAWLTRDIAVLELGSQTVVWLFPVLFTGSIAFVYDGYFLGIVQGRILRNSMFVSTFGAFLPIALGALYWQSNPLLWVALACYMGTRGLTLGYAKRKIG